MRAKSWFLFHNLNGVTRMRENMLLLFGAAFLPNQTIREVHGFEVDLLFFFSCRSPRKAIGLDMLTILF